MPDWSDPLEIAREAEIFQKLCLVMLGLSTWELIVQLPFDWSIISREREAHWPLTFYYLCKYSLWSGVVGSVIVTNATAEVDCQALYMFSQCMLGIAVGSASTLLMLRTIAVWNRAPLVTVPLVVASLGHWAVLLRGVGAVRSSWDVVTGACTVNAVRPVFLDLLYIYTMSFDLIILVLTTIGLVISPSRSSLWQLLFRQGIAYFIVAFIANMVVVIFLLLDLNAIMNMISCLPAAVATSIVACRAFVSLSNFRQQDFYVHSAMPYHSTRPRAVGGAGIGNIEARVGDPAKNNQGKGNTIANMVAGIDSMGQSHIAEDHDAMRTTSTLAVTNLKFDFGSISESWNGVVRIGTMTHDHDHVNLVELEKAESFGGGQGRKSLGV